MRTIILFGNSNPFIIHHSDKDLLDNDNPNASDGFGWMEAADEGWINSKTIDLR